jgi:multidrug efflux system outer membrane protein
MGVPAAVLSALLIPACALGPHYVAPKVNPPNDFRAPDTARITRTDASSFADSPWWSVFGDAELQRLIDEALAKNQDLQVAIARVEQARQLVGVASSERVPQVGYQASGGRQSFFLPGVSTDTVTYNFIGGALNAAWEFDIWGRIRRTVQAARANLLAQEGVRRGVVLTLVADVATGYFRLLELDRELSIAEESEKAYKDTADLFTVRFRAGRDSELASQRAQAAYEASLARIEDIKRQIAQQENALSVLVGANPRSIVRGAPLINQVMPSAPPGATTAVLQRRPDIFQAEQRMVLANAEIGVAVANFFPRIGLTLLGGAQVIDPDNRKSHTFDVWSIALDVSGPIFAGGRLRSAYEERKRYWDETVASYKQTVLVAFQETSDALVAGDTLKRRRAALEGQVAALRKSVDLALMRYDAGRASYFEVLEAQQELFPAMEVLAQTERDQLLAVVSLYRALGGGWQTPQDQAGPPRAPSTGSASRSPVDR